MTTENNNKNLNVPNLRFPEFNGEWERCSLGDITTNFSRRNKEEVRYPMFSVTNNRGFVPQSEQFEDREMVGEDIKAYKIIHKNDFAYNPARINVGSIAKYNGDEPCMISSLYVCFTADKRLDNEWLMQLLKTPKMNFYYNINGEGGVRVYLFYPNFARIKTSFPSLQEQQKISSFLALLDERIATQIKIIEKLESLIRGISNNLLYSESGTPVRLGDILSERSERTKVNNQHEVLSSTVKGIFSQREYFSKDIASENNVGYKVIRLHDVVLSPQNLWMGNINYNDKFDIGIVSPSYKIFSIADGYDKRFVAAMLKTHRALYNYMLVSEQGASVVRRNLNMEAFEQLVFKMPPIDKQREIGNAISALQSRLELVVRTKTAYEKQKQWLLTQMFI